MFSQKTTIQLHPNPANDNIQLSGIKNGAIRILNHLGKVVLDITYEGSLIDISELSAGMYIMQVISGNDFVAIPFVKS